MVESTELPAAYQTADAASCRGQRIFMTTVGLRLGGYFAAALGGALVWSVGGVDAWGAVAATGLLVALGAEIYALTTKPDRTWYEGRAAAESAKTLSWRYMVGGDPFGIAAGGLSEVDSRFVAELRKVFDDLESLEASPIETATQQITDTMRTHRALELEARRTLYDIERIENQREWYAKNARKNGKLATYFTIASVTLQLSGIVAAGLKAFEVVALDTLGVVGALGGAVLTWSQARQYRSLASAYSIAAQELSSIRSLMMHERTEDEWARYVDESEEAISREHTLWRASRGVTT